MLNNGEAAFVWVRALSLSLCLLSDTLLTEDALPHRSRREQGAGGHPVFSTGMVGGVGVRGRGERGCEQGWVQIHRLVLCMCVQREDQLGKPSNGQERRILQLGTPPHLHPHYTHTYTHTGSLQEYPVPICTNDSLCLMHFMEDEVGYSFGRRERVGEVSGRSALPYRFPSTHFSWSIFQQRARLTLGPAVMRFITGKVGRSPDFPWAFCGVAHKHNKRKYRDN